MREAKRERINFGWSTKMSLCKAQGCSHASLAPWRKASPAWRSLPVRLLRAPTKTHCKQEGKPIPRSSHLIAIHLEQYT